MANTGLIPGQRQFAPLPSGGVRRITARTAGRIAPAIGLFLLSLVLFDLMGLIIKHLSGRYSAAELSAYRNLFGLVPSLIALWMTASWRKGTRSLRIRQWKLAAVRGLSVTFAQLMFYLSLGIMAFATATTISYTTAIFTTALAVPILGERVGWVRWTAVALALTGAAVLLRPTPATFQPAALLALGAAVAMGTENIWIKKLTRREGRLQILLVNNMIGVCIAGTAALAIGWTAPTYAQWGALTGVGLSMAVAQSLYINGMARADASYVAPFNYGALVFAAIFDAVIFGAVPDWVSWLGAAVIVAGALLLALREGRKRPAGLHPGAGVVK